MWCVAGAGLGVCGSVAVVGVGVGADVVGGSVGVASKPGVKCVGGVDSCWCQSVLLVVSPVLLSRSRGGIEVSRRNDSAFSPPHLRLSGRLRRMDSRLATIMRFIRGRCMTRVAPIPHSKHSLPSPPNRWNEAFLV